MLLLLVRRRRRRRKAAEAGGSGGGGSRRNKAKLHQISLMTNADGPARPRADGAQPGLIASLCVCVCVCEVGEVGEQEASSGIPQTKRWAIHRGTHAHTHTLHCLSSTFHCCRSLTVHCLSTRTQHHTRNSPGGVGISRHVPHALAGRDRRHRHRDRDRGRPRWRRQHTDRQRNCSTASRGISLWQNGGGSAGKGITVFGRMAAEAQEEAVSPLGTTQIHQAWQTGSDATAKDSALASPASARSRRPFPLLKKPSASPSCCGPLRRRSCLGVWAGVVCPDDIM